MTRSPRRTTPTAAALAARRPARAGAVAVAGLAATMGLAGCMFTSPAQDATPYAAADGVNGQIADPASGTTVKLANMLLVSSGKDQPGVLVGAIAAEGQDPEQVQIAVLQEDPSSAQQQQGSQPLARTASPITATPGQLVQLGTGDGAEQLVVPSTPVTPGAVLYVLVQTKGGSTVLPLPVVANTGYYSSISPSATSTGTPPVSQSASPNPGDTSAASSTAATSSPASSSSS